MSGRILRDYLVLCHGYLPKSICQIDARRKGERPRPRPLRRLSIWLDITVAGGQGKPSRTRIKQLASKPKQQVR